MVRDLDRLTGRTFDVLVIGGGICGLAIAYDAAQRGLSVALIEKGDFGSGASFNHLRTIHGGLRYLQTFDLARARESMRERRTLARIAPHAVRPLPFAIPLFRSLLSGRLAMRAGFALDRLVAFDRNRGVPRALQLPAGRILSRAEGASRFPGLQRRHSTGVALWHDYVTLEADRLTFSFAIAAHEHGAVLGNYLDATALLEAGRRVSGARVRDTASGRELEIAAHLTVNATGAGIDSLLTPLGIPTGTPFVRAMNLVTRRDAGDEALGNQAKAGRHLFLVPWRGRAVLGTWESARAVGPASTFDASDIASFVRDLNEAFPALDLTDADITLVHRGIVPAVHLDGDRAKAAGHPITRDHSADAVSGLLSVAGTKYTTARAVAQTVVDMAVAKLGRSRVVCRTATTLLPGGSARDFALVVAEARQEHDSALPGDAIPHLVAAYGSRYRDVLALTRGRPEWCARVAEGSPVIGAQLIWAVRKEMAVTLADAVIRRTPLGALGDPGTDAVQRAAAIVGQDMKWPEERQRSEADAVHRFYERPDSRRTM